MRQRLLTSGALLTLAGILLAALVLAGCSREKKLKIGDPAPPFTVTSLDGETISLTAYQGKPVILRFWSTDCKFCRADTPIFNRYFDQYKKKGLRVVYINTDSTPAEVRKFVKDLDIIFPVVAQAGDLAKKYQVKVLPQTIVLDPDHRIMAAILGGVSEEELQDLLGKYLGGKPGPG
ncbi:MAG: redoxin domain-containing protein [Desulfobacteraceae bacterium]|nr:redoxin domain-containing protein [Desulfobacteraceae bacterium]